MIKLKYINYFFLFHPKWYRVLHAVHFGLTGGLLYVLVFGLIVAYVVSPVWLQPAAASGSGIFASNSFWNTSLPRYPTLHPNSAALVEDIRQQVILYGAGLDSNTQAAPLYSVDQSVPAVSVQPWDCDGGSIPPGLATEWQSVPIPFYAQPSDGAERTMIVFQPSAGTMWEFGRMQNVGGQWQACHGGKITNMGGSSGVFPVPYGVNDTGLALIGGQIGLDELRRGQIGHAIGLNLVNTSATNSWPAVRSQGNGMSAVPQGLRLQLDPAVNVDTLGLSPVGRMIAKAAQTYGFVVWGDGDGVAVRSENPKSYILRGLSNPYNGLLTGALNGFPWEKLRALPVHYGQVGAPPSIISFTASSNSVAAGRQTDLAWQAVDVDECAVPGVAGNLAASGSVKSADIHADTTYSLVCSGPGGSTTRNLSLTATDQPVNSPVPILDTTTIEVSTGENTAVIPALATTSAAEYIQKVVYYERDNWLGESTTPPFPLNTARLSDGRHVLELRVYYRDGHRANQEATIVVANRSQPLLVPRPLAASAEKSSRLPLLNGAGIIGAFGVMGFASWFGWHRTRLM